jgi:hypothetical protein
MEAAMTWGAATEAEQAAGEPLSPELVLVSPDLRERALRELACADERDWATPRVLRLVVSAQDRSDEPDDDEVSLLRTAGDSLLHVAVLAALFVLVVSGVATALTIAPGEPAPRFATGPAPPRPVSPAIGTAAVSAGVPGGGRPARSVDRWRRNLPVRLTTHGQLVWDLDALVYDVFGNRPVCLLHATNQLSPAACSASGQRQSAYRRTFDRAGGSELRLSKPARTPRLRGRAVPLSVGTKYVSCGSDRWVATGANQGLACQPERSKPR